MLLLIDFITIIILVLPPVLRQRSSFYLPKGQEGTTTKAAWLAFCKSNLRKDEPSWASGEQGCFFVLSFCTFAPHRSGTNFRWKNVPIRYGRYVQLFFVSNFEHILVIYAKLFSFRNYKTVLCSDFSFCITTFQDRTGPISYINCSRHS